MAASGKIQAHMAVRTITTLEDVSGLVLDKDMVDKRRPNDIGVVKELVMGQKNLWIVRHADMTTGVYKSSELKAA